jgi:hypothetical protein
MIHKLWPTNVWHEEATNIFGTRDFKEIIQAGNEFEVANPTAHVPASMRKTEEQSYNLLTHDSYSVQKFRRFLGKRMKEFAAEEGFLATPNFEAITTMRKFGPGDQVKPHNHRSVDYIAVMWIQVDVTDTGENTHQKVAGNRLQIMDPISMRNRLLNHTMLKEISPKAGTFVIHPAHLFHTAETNIGSIDTIALVTNIRVVEPVRNYVEI